MLQWGRARASAEIRAINAEAFKGWDASMGPRSCERGNKVGILHPDFRLAASMGPRSCERGNRVTTTSPTTQVDRLQWGRARASAEIGRLAVKVEPLQFASMGPRSCERGNAPELPSGARDRFARFNGAALVRARKCRSYVAILCPVCCFNGAALVRARKSPKS